MTTSYLLRTKPQGEAKAIAGLTRNHHAAFTPTEQRVLRASRHAKRKRVVEYPLAPRYIVAEAVNPHLLVHEIDEITGVVSTAGQTALRTADVARLRAMDGSKADTVIWKSLSPGQAVIVRDGPFRGHSSKIEYISMGSLDVTINLDILGKATPITMPIAFLDPL